ncbi:MAG TPA: hypothetical protein VFX17_03480 [Patescibacteria group bacterium]|nr:hypothetical protein [Patescibacteria group bacterium]
MTVTDWILIAIALEIAYIARHLERHLAEIAYNTSRSDNEKAEENLKQELT